MTAVELLQSLIRFDTTNPPGNERECVRWIGERLREGGLEPSYLGRSPERPSVVARLAGSGSAPPLLLYGHADVVTTEGQRWQVPPFEARIQDGFVWGRGALDMKGAVAMMLAALLRARSEGVELPGDVIFAIVPDEEAGGQYGARFLVDEHPGLFAGVRYAFGEFGGFSLGIGGKRVYPIMISEKQVCWMEVTFHGEGGHASIPVRGGAAARLGHALDLLDRRRLPVRITPPVRLMIERLAEALGGPTGAVLRALLRPRLTDRVLAMMGDKGRLFGPLLHDTVSPTMFHGSDKVNVIPSEVTLGLDGRLVPGARPEELVAELRALLGQDLEVRVQLGEPGPGSVDMGMFDTLASVLRELDAEGRPIPYVAPGVTDARHFARLGIQTYGFTPLRLPDGFDFVGTLHAADERVPVDALEFGTEAIFRAIQRAR